MKLRNTISEIGSQYRFSPTRAANSAQGDLDIKAIEGWVGFEGKTLHLVTFPQKHFSK